MDPRETTVIVVGAGLAGICAAHYLAEHKIPYLVLEKSDRAGGIWSRLDWLIASIAASGRPPAQYRSAISRRAS